MKKLAIITLYGEKNFGNKLQNYATQIYFSELGYECRTIKYCRRNRLLEKLLKIRYSILSSMHLRPAIPASEKIREKKFKGFTKQYIKMGRTINFNKVPGKLCEQYDYFVTGSDQVWHNYTQTANEIRYFMLAFAKPDQRMTISPSFGRRLEDIPSNLLEEYKKGLLGFNKISCREEEARSIIYSLTGQKAYVTLDPTMLIDEEYWRRLAKKPEFSISVKYILINFISGIHSEVQNFLTLLAAKYEMEIIDISDKDNVEKYAISPDEFLWLVRNAALVATDSFHSTVFSILLETPFLTYSRVDGTGMEDRIDSLLAKFDFLARKNLVSEISGIFELNFDAAEKVLSRERKIARKFYQELYE